MGSDTEDVEVITLELFEVLGDEALVLVVVQELACKAVVVAEGLRPFEDFRISA